MINSVHEDDVTYFFALAIMYQNVLEQMIDEGLFTFQDLEERVISSRKLLADGSLFNKGLQKISTDLPMANRVYNDVGLIEFFKKAGMVRQ